jgi:hypothetical protein
MSLNGASANLGLLTIGTNHPDFQSAAPTSMASVLNGLIAAVDNAIGNVEVKSADGAIASTQGHVTITKGTAANLTLAAPVAGLPSAGTPGNDGQELTIISETAAAHVITFPANKLNSNKTTATFGAAIANTITLRARNGVWWVKASTGVTLA